MPRTKGVYSPEAVTEYYDELGHGEWDRLDASAHHRLVFHLHTHFLRDCIGPSRSVLDAGCGAGRFSVHVARSGSEVTLLDISPQQLSIAKSKLRESGFDLDDSRFILGDVRDLSTLPSNTFDTTICYGGALNYLFHQAEQAIGELVWVTKPGGTLLASVMSRWGVFRFTLATEGIDPKEFFGRPEYWLISQVAETGDLPTHPDVKHPPRHFFTSDELRSRFQSAGLEEVELGSAPSMSAALYSRLDRAEEDETAWRVILGLEERAYCTEGLLDTGEHLLIRGRVPEDKP